MAVFGKCCCCDLKTGNVVLGSLCLLGTLLGLGSSANDINSSTNISGNLSQDLNTANNLLLMSSSIHLVLCILYIPASICLIIGALKDNRKLVVVFLVVDGINIVLIFLQMIIIFLTFGFHLEILITCLIAAAITIFIWLFPYSLYQTLQDSSAGGFGSSTGGQVHYPAQTQAGGQVYYPAQTQAGGQVHYPAQTQSYMPMSVAYPSQGQAPQAPPAYQPYPQAPKGEAYQAPQTQAYQPYPQKY